MGPKRISPAFRDSRRNNDTCNPVRFQQTGSGHRHVGWRQTEAMPCKRPLGNRRNTTLRRTPVRRIREYEVHRVANHRVADIFGPDRPGDITGCISIQVLPGTHRQFGLNLKQRRLSGAAAVSHQRQGTDPTARSCIYKRERIKTGRKKSQQKSIHRETVAPCRLNNRKVKTFQSVNCGFRNVRQHEAVSAPGQARRWPGLCPYRIPDAAGAFLRVNGLHAPVPGRFHGATPLL